MSIPSLPETPWPFIPGVQIPELIIGVNLCCLEFGHL